MIRKLFISFGNMISKKVDYLFRDMIFSLVNLTILWKINYLIRIYDLFIQEYAKSTPKWDELTLCLCFGGKQLAK